jgi:hypothetical protein
MDNIRLFVVHLTTFLINLDIQSRMKGWQVNEELEKMWKEAVVV